MATNYKKPDDFTGSANNVYTYNSQQAGIQEQMNKNSQAWWDAYDAGNTALMDSLKKANEALAAQLGPGVTKSQGYWTGVADTPTSVQTGVAVTQPTWNYSNYVAANPMPTYTGISTIKPTYDGYNVAKPTWNGYDVAKPTYDGYDVEKPVYTSQYQTQIDELLNQILNREEFSYDAESDPLYQQYKAQYNREGARAMNDTMAAAAINAGGMNSYAMTAAQQANDYYSAQLGDKIPELYQLAYSMYMDDLNNQRVDLDTLVGLDQNDYNKYRDEVSDWYTDKNFDYSQYRDQVSDWYADKNFAYGEYRDQVGDWYNDRDFDYGQYRDQVSDYYTDQDFAYNQYRDQMNDWYNLLNFSYGNYRDDMSDYKWGTEFNYGVERDQIADQRYDQEWDYAVSRDQIADQRYDQEWDYAVSRDQIEDTRYDSETAYNRAMEMLLNGVMPNADLLAAAGITSAEAAALKAASTPTVSTTSKSTSGSGGSGGSSGSGGTKKTETTTQTTTEPTTKEPTTETDELEIDMNSVLALGYGPISAERLEELEAEGLIKSYVVGNKIYFGKLEGSGKKSSTSGSNIQNPLMVGLNVPSAFKLK